MMLIGLTGGIGMGKSATAKLFIEEGLPVFDSDAVVHRLYAPGGDAVEPIGEAFPGVIVDGGVDRGRLSEALEKAKDGFSRLEAIVHPMVGAAREDFLRRAEAGGAWAVVFDIPLLFETGAEKSLDAVVVCTAPDEVRRERVLQRPGMTNDKLKAIIARQTPDSEKRMRADFLIETSGGEDDARRQVRKVVSALRKRAEETS